MTYQPPFHLTHAMTKYVAEISELIGAWKAGNKGALVPELRRGNRIKTIQASLAVEQNTLSLEQVTAVLEGKTVLGLPHEIQEVRNAFAAYEKMEQWQPLLAYLPVETVIKNRQQDYYRLLGEADKQADCSVFIEFLLQSILESLLEAIASQHNQETRVETRVETPPVKTEVRILALLEAHPELSLAEVANTIGRSVSAVERAVTKLKTQNRLIYEGPKKGGKWKVLRD